MKRWVQRVGSAIYWLAWPLIFVYLRLSRKRARVFLVADNQVLVVQGWVRGEKWCLPGGGAHHGEMLHQAAARELREETGVKVAESSLQPIGDISYSNRGHTFRFMCFVAKARRPILPKRQWYEIAEAEWVSLSELTRRNASPEVLLTVAAYNKLRASETGVFHDGTDV